MGGFTTVNKVDENNFICKYDVYDTKEEADARIAELHQIAGYEDAFVVDNDATAVDGVMCFKAPNCFPVNKAIRPLVLIRVLGMLKRGKNIL